MSAKARQKTGPGVSLRAEGFFCLDLLLLFYQEKSSSPRGNERTEFLIKNENSVILNEVKNDKRVIQTLKLQFHQHRAMIGVFSLR
jgi:hypothetical protein